MYFRCNNFRFDRCLGIRARDIFAFIADFFHPIFARRLGTGFLATIIIVCCIGEQAQAATFPDVSARHPNSAAIETLTSLGVFHGYPDGTFRPGKPVNRAEALKIIFLSSGIPIDATATSNFPDVPTDSWFQPFVATAKLRNIIGGYPDGTFQPDQTVNLVEALKILLVTNGVDLTSYFGEQKNFSDTDTTAWYGPFINYAAAFELLSPNSNGQVKPSAPLTRAALSEIIYRFRERVTRICPKILEGKESIATNYFTQISLGSALPNIFFEGEVASLKGRVVGAATTTKVTVFYIDSSGAQTTFTGNTTQGSFRVPVTFRHPGSYQFSILPGAAGQGYAANIEVAPRECAPAEIDQDTAAPADIKLDIVQNRALVRYRLDGGANLVRAVIRQGNRRYERLISGGQNEFAPDPLDFADWQQGNATLQLFAAKSENGYSTEPHTRFTPAAPITLELSQHHFSEYRPEEFLLDGSLPTIRSGNSITLKGTARVKLSPTAYVINPKGIVEDIKLDEKTIAVGTNITVRFPTELEGTYILEINDTAGLAVVNHPLYEAGLFPVLPDFIDLRTRQKPATNISLNREKSIWLRLVNDERTRYGLSPVELDSKLTLLAQNYANRMVKENFFGHLDTNGNTPNDRRLAAGIITPVGENLAKDIFTTSAHSGLMRSASHRENILDPAWTQVGLGISQDDDGSLIFVQEFSTTPLTSEVLPAVRSALIAALNEKRQAAKNSSFTLSDELTDPVQNWSTKMISEDFFGFENNDNSLETTIRATGIKGAFSTFVVSADSTSGIVDSLLKETARLTGKQKVSIGLAQDNAGIYRATLVFW